MINKNRLVKLTQKLIRIDSQNPGKDESRIARYVRDYLAGLGVKTRIHEFKKRRSNVIGILEGKNKRKTLLITPHLDTVPAGQNWRFDPLEAKLVKGKIYGLGATDCKGNLACALEAVNSLVEDKFILDYNLIFAATCDEETGSKFGLIPLLDKGILRPDVALVLDSDEFDLIITQKGLIHLKVKIKGRRAHGAYPWRGINAIDIAVQILRDLKSYKFKYTKNKYLKSPTLNIGTIRGGDKVNIVADWCEFQLDIRFLPGMSAKNLLKDIRTVIRKHTRQFKIEIEGIQKPYSIDPNHALATYLKKATQKIRIRPMIKGSEGATTMTFFQNKNIPAVATGFGSRACAHIANEYVRIDNLYKGAKVLEEFLKSYRFENNK